MTINGTIHRTGILLLCVLATALWTWSQFFATRDPSTVAPYLLIGGLGGFVMALVTVFKKEWSGVTAPVYALLEGLFLGGISATLELRFPGIAIEAVALTFGTCCCLLLAYRSGWICATGKFTLGIVAATGGIALVYVLSMVASLFHVQVPYIFGGGPIGILFSLVVVVIAALNLILDFDFIEQGARGGAPKAMEVVCGLRPDGHPDLAVSRNAQVTDEAARQALGQAGLLSIAARTVHGTGKSIHGRVRC